MSEHVLPNILLENFNEANLLRLPAKFYKSAKQYLNKDEIKKIQTAYSLAFYAHDGQDRMDGSKYITHPLAVATILLDLKMDPDSICAAFMHDVLEDCDVTKKNLEDLFGNLPDSLKSYIFIELMSFFVYLKCLLLPFCCLPCVCAGAGEHLAKTRFRVESVSMFAFRLFFAHGQTH